MPKIQTYDIYLIPAAGATKTYVVTDNVDIYELNATGGAVTLVADMIFTYSGTPVIGSEFKFQYGGGVTSNTAGGITVSIFGTNLTDAQALSPLVITAYWNGTAWEIMIVKDTNNNVVSVGAFGSTPNVNGLTIASGVLNMQPADASFGGGVSITTQTFAGAKTFNILSGNFSIDSNGVGIGIAASSSRYVNITKTYTTQPPALGSNISILNNTVYNYAAANTDNYSISVGINSSALATGIYTPKVLTATLTASGNNMTGVTLEKSFGVRSSHISTGSQTENCITTFNADFISATIAAKNSNTTSFNITTNHSFYSAIPFQNNDVAGATPSLFTIDKQYGFYCEQYSGNRTPTIYGSGAGTKVSAVINNAWQLYMSGTTLTTVGSYIGNRLGIGFAVEPALNSEVTALLHIGAGTTSSAQIRLVVGVAPTAPNDGDIWLESNTNTGLKIRIAGVTKTVSLV